MVRYFGRTSDLELAEQAITRREFAQARTRLDQHLETHPHDVKALFLAARTARRDHDLTSAGRLLGEYERKVGTNDAVRLESELLVLQHKSAKLTAGLLARCREIPDSQESALILESILETTLNILAHPHGAHAPFTADQAGQPVVVDAKAAIDLWFAHPRTGADQVQGFIWRARLRELCGEHPGALSDVREALRLHPDHRYATSLLARFQLQEAPEQSRAIFEKLLAQDPDDAYAAFEYALALRETGRVTEAQGVLDGLLQKQPTDLRALLYRGLIALDQDRPTEADEYLRRAILADRTEPETYFALSRSMRRQGRLDEAAKYQELYLKLFREAEERKK